tara:strand:- start:77 stop:550 length:474 start_codon:yes stop_codon:yes gene_type:complete
MKKITSILLLVSHTSLLFADTLTFKSGQKIEGELIKVSEEHELDPNTGTTSEVTFKVDKFSINMIPNEMIVGKLNENIFLFDQKSIYKIIDNQGNILFSSDKSLITAEKATIIALSKADKVMTSKPAKIISGTAMTGFVVIVIIPVLLAFISLFIEG